jgi:hypothetical protein
VLLDDDEIIAKVTVLLDAVVELHQLIQPSDLHAAVGSAYICAIK